MSEKNFAEPRASLSVGSAHAGFTITSVEQELDHVFVLTDPENEVYRCMYCEEKYERRPR